MNKKEIIEDLCHKVADIKYDLQVVLDTLYQLDNEEPTSLEKAQEEQIHKLMDESVKLKNEIAKLKKENVELEERNDELNIQVVELNNDKAVVEHEVFTLERDVRRLHDLGQGYYDDMMKFKAEVEFYTKEYNALVQRKDEAEAHVNALEQPERPTMPVIPKADIGTQFMGIMQDYQERQNDDPNFDPRTALYDLYDDLVYIYEKAQDNE